MRRFLKFRIWDCLLCTAIATGLVSHVFSGFYLSDSFSASVPYVILFMAAAMFMLTLFSWSMKTVIAGVITGVALSQIMLVYVRRHDVFGGQAGEEANSLFISLTAAALTAILVYLCCRGACGLMVLYLAGNILICGSHFLQFPIEPWPFVLFTFASLLMFWYRNYMFQLSRSQAGKIRLPRYMVQSMLIGLLCICLGGVCYFRIVCPLEPPTRELKLIQILKHNEIIRLSGVYSVNENLDPDISSPREPDSDASGNDNADQDKGTDTGGFWEGSSASELSGQGKQLREHVLKIFYMLRAWTWLPWIVLGIVLAAACLWLLRKLGKHLFWSRLRSLSAEGQVINLYKIIYAGLLKAGLDKPPGCTLYEYAADHQARLEAYTAGDATFTKLTEIYVRILYGHGSVMEDERKLFYQFYGSYRKTMRSEAGMLRYLFKGLWL